MVTAVVSPFCRCCLVPVCVSAGVFVSCYRQGGTNPERREFTVSVVFVMSKDTAPPEGELVGDILYVPVSEGYRNIVLKTKAMLCLVRRPPAR